MSSLEASVSASVVSVNVGTPRQVELRDRILMTSIFKEPVEGRVPVMRHNLAGDRQSDLRVHGGPHKAVYAYPAEHYRYWSQQLPGMDLPCGMFGENLTTKGLIEDEVRIGDRLRVGTAVLQVTQPRMPCFKLSIRFGRSDMVKLFWQSGRCGIYFSVVAEGDVAAGDAIEIVATAPEGITVGEVIRLYRGDEKSPALLERALRAPLHGSWKADLRERSKQLSLPVG